MLYLSLHTSMSTEEARLSTPSLIYAPLGYDPEMFEHRCLRKYSESFLEVPLQPLCTLIAILCLGCFKSCYINAVSRLQLKAAVQLFVAGSRIS